jgi:hypothetical protein
MNQPLFWAGWLILLVGVPVYMYYVRREKAALSIIVWTEFMILIVGLFIVWYLYYYKP